MSSMETDQVGGEDQKRQGLVTVNDLNYTLEPDLSVAVNRTGKKHFFQSTEYKNNQQGICILNSGADYIDTRTSYLSLEIDINNNGGAGDARGHFGQHGSICNIIDTLTVSTRSGDELCRITDFGLLQNMLIPMQYDKDWCDTVGSLMGYGDSVHSSKAVCHARGGRQRFLIPMYILAPLFGYGRLMPAMLMSGLRFLFTWATPEKAFMSRADTKARTDQYNEQASTKGVVTETYGGVYPADFDNFSKIESQFAVTEFTVKNAYFYLTSVQLSDSIQRALNEQSATNGLEIVYTDYERTESVYQGAAVQCNIEIRKSCSRALKAFCRVRASTGTTKEAFRDSFRSEKGFPWVEYQWQLGSLYFPQQPVRAEVLNIYGMAPEAFAHLLEACDKYTAAARQPRLSYNGSYNSSNPSHYFDASITDFSREAVSTANKALNTDTTILSRILSGPTYMDPDGSTTLKNSGHLALGQSGSFIEDSHTIGVNLERTSLFNLAGVPVNNSRVLAFKAQLSKDCAEPVMMPGRAIGSSSSIGVPGEPSLYIDTFGYAKDCKSRTFSIYLKYVKLCRVFLNNVEVEQ